jgi:hypothetical protein
MGSGARVGTRETSGRGTDSEPTKRFRRVTKRQANGQTIHGNNGERLKPKPRVWEVHL